MRRSPGPLKPLSIRALRDRKDSRESRRLHERKGLDGFGVSSRELIARELVGVNHSVEITQSYNSVSSITGAKIRTEFGLPLVDVSTSMPGTPQRICGPEGIRTPDLLNAIQTRSQTAPRAQPNTHEELRIPPTSDRTRVAATIIHQLPDSR